jgi:hypothetical protein
MWERKMPSWIRVSQISWRLPKARNVLFRLSPTELLSGQVTPKCDSSIVPETTVEQKKDSEAYGFRPLTEDEKKEFENSLNDDGKKILRELSGKLLTDVERERNQKKRSVRSSPLIPTVDP